MVWCFVLSFLFRLPIPIYLYLFYHLPYPAVVVKFSFYLRVGWAACSVYLRVGWAACFAARTEWKRREAMRGSTPVVGGWVGGWVGIGDGWVVG